MLYCVQQQVKRSKNIDKKRLFPGVTQEDLDKQQRAAAANANAAEEKEQAAKDAAERERLLKEAAYVHVDSLAGYKKEAIKGGLFGLSLGLAVWLVLSFYVNGFIDTFQGKEAGGQKWVRSVVNPFVDGKFAPTATWYRQIAFMLASLGIVLGMQYAFGSSYADSKKRIRTVDMMLGLKKFGEKYNLNTRQVKKLVKDLRFIVSNMAAEERVYFDMLMKSKINIRNKETFMNMAAAIMEGHLNKHPEDAQLILDTFEEKSLPDDLFRKCQSCKESLLGSDCYGLGSK